MRTHEGNAEEKARGIFRSHQGVLRTADAIRLGVHRRTLYAMRDSGLLEQISRGLYRLADLPPLGNPDLVTVALKIPHGVICLISALAFHDLTTQVPHEVYVAIRQGSEPPRLSFPPIRIFWFSGNAFSEGAEIHKIGEIPLHIYSPEKTVADCFKHRYKIGIEVALEALKAYRRRKSFNVDKLIRCARICRVEKVMRPYLEAIL
ncbi:MAG: type IV toxin-antitoxin system AbiEi family antitoxin domain-containing protein [Deltaproteobacteria bacterium]|nr:type IV toxin-antitoxin system AbiEi family antitoxin domain-containing protein [Deltaproteobacteria bacterium]